MNLIGYGFVSGSQVVDAVARGLDDEFRLFMEKHRPTTSALSESLSRTRATLFGIPAPSEHEVRFRFTRVEQPSPLSWELPDGDLGAR